MCRIGGVFINKQSLNTWLKSYRGHSQKQVFFLTLLNLIMSLSLLAIVFFSQDMIHFALDSNRSGFIERLLVLGVLLIVLMISLVLVSHLEIYLVIRLRIVMRQNYFLKIMNSTIKDTKLLKHDTMMNNLQIHIDTVSRGVIEIIPQVVFNWSLLIGAFSLLLIVDAMIAAAILSVGLVLYLNGWLWLGVFKRRDLSFQNVEKEINSLEQQSFSNVSLVKSFEANQHIASMIVDKQKDWFTVMMNKQRMTTFYSFGRALFYISSFGIAMIWGALRLSNAHISLGAYVAIILLVGLIGLSFYHLHQNHKLQSELIMSVQKLMVLDSINEDVNDPYPIQSFDKLVIKNLTFSYDNIPIIRDLSTTITKGSIIRIIGDSGPVKTMFFQLLLGLIEPDSGELYFITNKKHYPIHARSRHLWSYVPQNHFILSGTIRENVCLFQDATEEQLIAACRSAELLTDILMLSQGFNTKLDEHGLPFNEQQIQKLSIARALLRNAPILLLDEISMNLDLETEKKIFESLRKMTDKTILIISSRELDSKVYDISLSL